MSLASYFYNLFRGVDQLGNATLDGNSRQTISSRAYEGGYVKKPFLWRWRIVCWVIDGLNYVVQVARGKKPYAHCKDAYLSDQKDRTYA